MTDSVVGKSNLALKVEQTAEKPKTAELPKSDPVQSNGKASTDRSIKSEVEDENKTEDKSQALLGKPQEPEGEVPSSPSPTYKKGGARNRLSMELTSMFEGSSVPLPPQPASRSSTAASRKDRIKVEPEPSRATPEPSTPRDGENGGLGEEGITGGSIKRRISRLFDASSRPEVVPKKEEPDVLNFSGGVKARIKNWSAEKGGEPEKKPQVVVRAQPKRWVIVNEWN